MWKDHNYQRKPNKWNHEKEEPFEEEPFLEEDPAAPTHFVSNFCDGFQIKFFIKIKNGISSLPS